MDKQNPYKPEPFPNAAHSSDLPCSLSLKLWVSQNFDVRGCLGNGAAMEKAGLPVIALALNFPGEGISGLCLSLIPGRSVLHADLSDQARGSSLHPVTSRMPRSRTRAAPK